MRLHRAVDRDRPWQELERLVRATPMPAMSTSGALPELVQRYRDHALSPRVRPAPSVRLSMRGRIKIGRWLPFAATQLLAPRIGTVWRARVGGIVVGSDRYVGGRGGMDWRVLGLVPLVHAEGPDVSRSAAERAAAESIWAPAAMWTPDVAWTTEPPDVVQAEFTVDDHPVTLRHRIDDRGRVTSSSLARWGDPDRTGRWSAHAFGVEVTGERTFDGVTIPHRGRVGWHFGTTRWPEGVFFEFELTSHALVTGEA